MYMSQYPLNPSIVWILTIMCLLRNPSWISCSVCFLFSLDCELFVTEFLQDEELSESAQETRKMLLNNFRVVHLRYDFEQS